jgi:hypothetical protein
MNITQVYLTPDHASTVDRQLLVKYQSETSYIQLFIEKCLREHKRDVGAFNRLVFSEGGDERKDFSVVGNNAMPISIKKTYEELKPSSTDHDAHNYYVSKFDEGFKKFDSHFRTNFAETLGPLIADQFRSAFVYEYEISRRSVGKTTVAVVGRYSRTRYQLLIRRLYKGEPQKETCVHECSPDFFLVRLRLRKAVISEDHIRVLDKLGKETLSFKTGDFI